MTQIFLSHNPFLNETYLTIDGQVVAAESTLAERLSAPMSRWTEEFFDLLGEHLNWPETIELSFCGLVTDYDDLQLAAQIGRGKHPMRIELSCQPIASPIDRLAGLEQLFDEGKRGPLRALHSDTFQESFRRAMEPGYEVNVIATMSSGKSTVINSILGQDLLPSKNLACTATIARIHDQKDLPRFEGSRLDADGQPLDPRGLVDRKLLNVWNSDKQTSQIELFGNIPHVARHAHTNLVLVDTPGPNNSGDPRHGQVTRAAITSKAMPLVLYVLNATQLAINDDQHLLGLVRDEMRRGDKRVRDRFVFLVNKIDDIDTELESIDEILATARAYLENNGIRNPVILPVSAKVTKLIRQRKGGHVLTAKEGSELPGLCAAFVRTPELQLLRYMNVSAGVRQRATELIQCAVSSSDEEALAELYSGMPCVELVIDEYLCKYALPDRIYQTQKLLDNFLQQAEDEARSFEELKHRSQEELVDLQTELQRIQLAIQEGERSRQLKDELCNKVFEIPPQVAKEIETIKARFQEQQTALINRLDKKSVTRSYAQELIDTAKAKAEEIHKDVVCRLESAIDLARQAEMMRLTDAYQDYVNNLFGSDFSLVEMPAIARLQAVAIAFGETEQLVARHSRVEVVGRRKRSTSVWYQPWTWLDEEEVVDREMRATLSPLVTEFSAKLRANFNTLLKSAENAMQELASEVCIAFIDTMDARVERELQRLVEEARVAASDGQVREQRIAEAEHNLAWIANFKMKLAGILSAH